MICQQLTIVCGEQWIYNGRSRPKRYPEKTAVLTPISQHPSRTQSVSKFCHSESQTAVLSSSSTTNKRPFSNPISHQSFPLSRSQYFTTQEGKRPLSHPPTQPTNGRSPPQALITQPHPASLIISLLRKPNGRSHPNLSSPNRTQSVS